MTHEQDNLHLGPFPARDLPEVTRILEGLGVRHEAYGDRGLIEDKIEQMQAPRQTHHRTSTFDNAVYRIAVPSEDAQKIGNHLEHFGVLISDCEPSFEDEEFHCTRCGFTKQSPGYCPHHSLKLLPFSEYVAARQQRREFGNFKPYAWLVLSIGLIALVFYLRTFF